MKSVVPSPPPHIVGVGYAFLSSPTWRLYCLLSLYRFVFMTLYTSFFTVMIYADLVLGRPDIVLFLCVCVQEGLSLCELAMMTLRTP